MATDDRTADMALLPSEREMSPEAWAEYGGLPPGLRSYCWRLMRQEGDARVRLREAELEVAEWRDRTSRLLSRAEAAEQRAEAAEAEVGRLRAELAQARADRALMTGLWLATVPPTKLPALLPANPADRYRLAAVFDAADVQPDFEACIAAGRAVIERIFADAEGGTGADARAADMWPAAERGAR